MLQELLLAKPKTFLHNSQICESFVSRKLPKGFLTTYPLFNSSQNPSQCTRTCYPPLSLDSPTYTKLVQFSAKTGSLIHGRLAHSHIIRTSFKPCLFLLNNLLTMYCKCNRVDVAQLMFDRMRKRNVVSWNSLISGYTQIGCYDTAMLLFREARMDALKLDKFTYACVLSVCAQTENIELGKVIHGLIEITGMGRLGFLSNSLIDMYSKCGHVDQAGVVFEHSDELDEVAWSSLMVGYSLTGSSEEVLRLLVRMRGSGLSLSTSVLGIVLKVCSNSDCSSQCGKMVHGSTVKMGLDMDIVVGTALLDMYAKIGNLHDATRIFKAMPSHSVVMYNAMMAGLLNEAFADEALCLFGEMLRQGMKPSKYTFSSVLKACSEVRAVELGKQIHVHIYKSNLHSEEFIRCALIELYSSNGSINDGVKCFYSTPKHDIVSWTAMISGHVQHGQFASAVALFNELLTSGIKADEFILCSMLTSCADLAITKSGEQIQGYAIKTGYDSFTAIQNSKICMYAKSGDIDSACLAFKEIKDPDVVSWTLMICSKAQNGCAGDALSLFEEMKYCQIAPNEMTLTGILTACSHGGLVDEGLQYFESFKKDYGMVPNVKHFACIVDLLGRAGRLRDAEDFIWKSGFVAEPLVWRALLSACRVHKDTETGKRIAEKVIEFEPQVAAPYVLLYNMYTSAGLQMLATEVRELMKHRGVKKAPGLSWIEVKNTVHSFVAGDTSHPQSKTIYARLELMLEKIKRIGSVQDSLVSEPCVTEFAGSSVANHHSEKLAVTFGIVNLPTSAPVRVMKNLRVCSDCHASMKLLSKVEDREIILRDPLRFHHFRNGSCSCKDYW